MPVYSQEAYYWTYAQHPDLSYFDHPPMVAWLIWLGTAVFGDGAVGVRFGTWLCGLGTAWFGVLLLRDFQVSKFGQSLWLLVSMGCPILVVARCLANPDPPLVCFWTLTLALWRARGGSFRWWMIAGAAAGLALLSRYMAAFLAIGGVVMLLLDPQLRRQLLRPAPYLAVAVAAIVFLPVVIWNVRNDFESFRFQTEGRFARGGLTAKWLLELVGGQFGLFNPLLAVLLPPSIWWSLHRLRASDPRVLLLLAFGLPLPCYLVFQSLWIQVKLNWLTPAYVPLLLGIVLWWQESGVDRVWPHRLKWAAMSAVMLLVALPRRPWSACSRLAVARRGPVGRRLRSVPMSGKTRSMARTASRATCSSSRPTTATRPNSAATSRSSGVRSAPLPRRPSTTAARAPWPKTWSASTHCSLTTGTHQGSASAKAPSSCCRGPTFAKAWSNWPKRTLPRSSKSNASRSVASASTCSTSSSTSATVTGGPQLAK